MNKQQTGKLGESHAEKFLNAKNYRILEKNFFSRFGEIDLIAMDLNVNPHQLVFLEVKTRTGYTFGAPQEGISGQKISRMYKTAMHFLKNPAENHFRYWRIDAIAVKLKKDWRLEDITHFKNILDGYR